MAVPTARHSMLAPGQSRDGELGGIGEIDLFDGATFTNPSGATFNEQTNDTISSDVGSGESPSGLFDNQGRFVVEGGGSRWSPPSTTKARSRSAPAPGS